MDNVNSPLKKAFRFGTLSFGHEPPPSGPLAQRLGERIHSWATEGCAVLEWCSQQKRTQTGWWLVVVYLPPGTVADLYWELLVSVYPKPESSESLPVSSSVTGVRELEILVFGRKLLQGVAGRMVGTDYTATLPEDPFKKRWYEVRSPIGPWPMARPLSIRPGGTQLGRAAFGALGAATERPAQRQRLGGGWDPRVAAAGQPWTAKKIETYVPGSHRWDDIYIIIYTSIFSGPTFLFVTWGCI